MGWQSSHLHEFVVGGVSFGEPAEEDNYGPIDERRIRLSQLIRRPGDRITYVYDFGDGWSTTSCSSEPCTIRSPRARRLCLAGARACPPEDCGGIGGYADFLAAIADPDHERHDEYRQWIGGDFDAEHFDLGAINRALARGKPRPRGA